MLQVLLKWSYFKMECHYSVNQLISETLISVFMKQTDCQETPGIYPLLIMVRNAETGLLLLHPWKPVPSPRPLPSRPISPLPPHLLLLPS